MKRPRKKTLKINNLNFLVEKKSRKKKKNSERFQIATKQLLKKSTKINKPNFFSRKKRAERTRKKKIEILDLCKQCKQ